MELPNIREDCIDAIISKAEQDNVYMCGAEFLLTLLLTKRKGLVSLITTASEKMFPDSLNNQAKTAAAIVLVLKGLHATLEAQELEEQLGD